MKLIIFTQKVDSSDANLGFFTEWLKTFSVNCQFLTVVCWHYSGEEIAENTKIIAVKNKILIWRVFEVLRIFIQNRHNYDRIFVHMLPEIVVLLMPIKIIFNKTMYLWYTHKAVSGWLFLAEMMVNRIFTASKESFRLKSKKVAIVGHGINVGQRINFDGKNKTIITVGRISRVKKLEELIRAVEILVEIGHDVNYRIIGPCIYDDDKKYLQELYEYIGKSNLQNHISVLPGVSHGKVLSHLNESSIFIHQSDTGSLDKAPLEAMGRGLLTFSSSDAIVNVLENIDKFFIFQKDDYVQLAKKIDKVFSDGGEEWNGLSIDMYNYVKLNFSLPFLISKIINLL